MLHMFSVLMFSTILAGAIVMLTVMLRTAAPAIFDALNVRPQPQPTPSPLPPRIRLVATAPRGSVIRQVREAA